MSRTSGRASAGGLAVLAAILIAQRPGPAAAGAENATAGAPAPAAIEVFVRDGCPRCADAEAFLEALRREDPGLVVTVRDVGRDAAALARLRALAAATGAAVSVPAFAVRGELLVGFADAATTGPCLRELLAGGTVAQADVYGGSCACGAEAPCVDAGTIRLPWIHRRIGVADVGLPLFTIAIGLMDGFNPCSMWVLLMMVSMLAAVGDRRRMIAVAGTFVAIQGIAYFAFMAAWLNLFLLIGISRLSEIALGLVAVAAGLVNVKDFVALGRGPSLSIPRRAKPGIVERLRHLVREQRMAVTIAGTVVLAVLVQLVELLCTSGLPALYTRILTLQQLDPWRYYGYLLLYNVMYMLDDVVVLTVGVVTLSQHRLQRNEGRLLKLLSGVAMVLLGGYLLLPSR